MAKMAGHMGGRCCLANEGDGREQAGEARLRSGRIDHPGLGCRYDNDMVGGQAVQGVALLGIVNAHVRFQCGNFFFNFGSKILGFLCIK